MILASIIQNTSEALDAFRPLARTVAAHPLRILWVGNPLRLLLPLNLRKLLRFLLAVRKFRKALRAATEAP